MSILRPILGDFGSSGAAYDPDTETLLEAMTVWPGKTRAELIDYTIRGLKLAGVWTDVTYIFATAAHDEQASTLNWRDPNGSSNLVAVNGPAFTENAGWTGDGSSTYLRLGSGLAPNSLSGFAQNDAHFGFWGDNNTSDMVGTDATGTTAFQGDTSGTPAFRFTINDVTEDDLPIAARNGHLVAVRDGASSKKGFRNGTSVGTISRASTTVSSNTINLLKTRGTFTSNTLHLFHAGAALSAEQVQNLYTIFNDYLSGVGAI